MPRPTPEQIDAFETAPAQIASAIEGLSETEMHFIPAIGEWSIHEIVIHLADSEAGGYWRLRKTLAEKEATLPMYDQDAWMHSLSYRIQDRRLAMQLFAALRASNAALLRLVPEHAWERTSVHPENGEMSVYDLFNLYVDHSNAHLKQIERLKQALALRAAERRSE
jgi:DinB superfamily